VEYARDPDEDQNLTTTDVPFASFLVSLRERGEQTNSIF